MVTSRLGIAVMRWRSGRRAPRKKVRLRAWSRLPTLLSHASCAILAATVLLSITDRSLAADVPDSVYQARLERFKADHKVEYVTIGRDGWPRLVRGELTAKGQKGDPVETVLSFFEENVSIIGFEDPRRNLSLTGRKLDTLTGREWLHFGQTYKGIRVEQGSMMATFSDAGSLRYLTIVLKKGIDLPTEPMVDRAGAETIAVGHPKIDSIGAEPTAAELAVCVDGDTPRLTWIIKFGRTLLGYYCKIDALTGELFYFGYTARWLGDPRSAPSRNFGSASNASGDVASPPPRRVLPETRKRS